MSSPDHQVIGEAIDRLSQSDPIVKLLHEVKLGRMKPTDAGLRAITEAWLETYRNVLQQVEGCSVAVLQRLDPRPRLEVLVQVGVLTEDHPVVMALRSEFQQSLARKQSRMPPS